jgi:phosphotransacetylase
VLFINCIHQVLVFREVNNNNNNSKNGQLRAFEERVQQLRGELILIGLNQIDVMMTNMKNSIEQGFNIYNEQRFRNMNKDIKRY